MIRSFDSFGNQTFSVHKCFWWTTTVVALTVAAGCQQSTASDTQPIVEPPAASPSQPANPMVGKWEVETPVNLRYHDGQLMGTLHEAWFVFHEDKTWECTVRATLASGGPGSDRSGSYKGFWEVDGRRLTVENPDAFISKAVIMLNSDLKSFDWNLPIPDTAAEFQVRFIHR